MFRPKRGLRICYCQFANRDLGPLGQEGEGGIALDGHQIHLPDPGDLLAMDFHLIGIFLNVAGNYHQVMQTGPV